MVKVSGKRKFFSRKLAIGRIYTPKDMPTTEILMDFEGISQLLQYRRRMKIPDEIKITPVEVDTVKIKANGYTFTISKRKKQKPLLRIRYADYGGEGLNPKERDKLVEDARRLGYEVKLPIIITDV